VSKRTAPPKRDTQPDKRRTSGPAPRTKRFRSDVPTLPPPKSKRSKAADTKTSGTRSRKPPRKTEASGATVDEVTADFSKDARRERDDD
jgi:hypothetical protein